MGTLRRHAAARVALPRADPRAGATDAGRAIRRARCVHARGTVVRAARPLAEAQLHGDPGHPRPARGGVSSRQHLRHEFTAGAHRHDQDHRFPASTRTRHLLPAEIRRHHPRIARQDRRGAPGMILKRHIQGTLLRQPWSTPSPRRGEAGVQGVRNPSRDRNPSPHPSPYGRGSGPALALVDAPNIAGSTRVLA